jgi:hypothetical protein
MTFPFGWYPCAASRTIDEAGIGVAQHSAVGMAEDEEDIVRLGLGSRWTRRVAFGAVETRGVPER